MNHCSSSRFAGSDARRGNATLLVVVFLVIAAGIGSAVWWIFFREKADGSAGPILNEVTKGPYDFVVLEQGEVEAANAIELRCEVKSRGAGGSGGGGGISILEVVPEGTLAKKGDVLVRLDSSALEQELKQQTIVVNTSKALVVQAQNTLEAAKIARKEYLEGTFRNEERLIKSEVFVAEQNLRTAQLSYESAQRLAAKGLVTPLQLDGAQFAVQKAQNELDNANGKLEVLNKYTKEKMLKQFDSDIATAEAKVKAEESSHAIEEGKLKDVEEQLAKCTIKAPADGQVVYANKFDRGRSGSTAEFVVEAGATLREQQPIIRLPSSSDMQVKALVNEARVTLVRSGQPVTIRVDALKDELIQGEVVKVNQYAEPGSWSSGNIKKYATLIKIKEPPPSLRSGMNAEVRIHIERRQEALQVPVQALAEYRGKFFVVVPTGEKYETREVSVGSTNDKTAVIEKGLELGEKFVMNPRGTSLLRLPDLPEPTIVKGDVQLAKGPGGAPVVNPAAVTNGTGGPGAAPVDAKGGPEGGKRGKGGKGNFDPAAMVNATMDRDDADKDGKLSMAEIANSAIPEQFRQGMIDADANKDGFVDRAELTARMAARRPRPEGGGGGPPGGGPGGGVPGGGP
jgi:RND family efflux transporter MFP subunit